MNKNSVKLVFKMFDERSNKIRHVYGITYNWGNRILKIGGYTKYELIFKAMLRNYFKENIFLTIVGDRIKVRERGGRKNKETKNKIVFKGKCKNFTFKKAIKALEESKKNGEINFNIVDSIGRLFN